LANLSTIIFLKAKFTIGGREKNLAKNSKYLSKKRHNNLLGKKIKINYWVD
jgi:hypothetical protein